MIKVLGVLASTLFACTSAPNLQNLGKSEVWQEPSLEKECGMVDPNILGLTQHFGLQVRLKVDLGGTLDKIAYYDRKRATILIDPSEKVDRGVVCTHELIHVVLDKLHWDMENTDLLLKALAERLKQTNLYTNDLTQLTKDLTTMLQKQLPYIANYLDKNKVNLDLKKLTNLIQSYVAFMKEHVTIIANPLMHNYNQEARYKLQAFLQQAHKLWAFMLELLETHPIEDEPKLVSLRSRLMVIVPIMHNIKNNYFYQTSVGEFMVQMLTVLFVNKADIHEGHLNHLNALQLEVLSDLKIEGLDLVPYIQRYREAHKL